MSNGIGPERERTCLFLWIRPTIPIKRKRNFSKINFAYDRNTIVASKRVPNSFMRAISGSDFSECRGVDVCSTEQNEPWAMTERFEDAQCADTEIKKLIASNANNTVFVIHCENARVMIDLVYHAHEESSREKVKCLRCIRPGV